MIYSYFHNVIIRWLFKSLNNTGINIKKKIVITHHKDKLIGDYLIDDRLKNGAEDFKGELLSFGWAYERKEWNEYPTWDHILHKLLKK